MNDPGHCRVSSAISNLQPTLFHLLPFTPTEASLRHGIILITFMKIERLKGRTVFTMGGIFS